MVRKGRLDKLTGLMTRVAVLIKNLLFTGLERGENYTVALFFTELFFNYASEGFSCNSQVSVWRYTGAYGCMLS